MMGSPKHFFLFLDFGEVGRIDVDVLSMIPEFNRRCFGFLKEVIAGGSGGKFVKERPVRRE